MFNEDLALNCFMVGELFDKDGNLKQKVEKHNMILNAGFDFILSWKIFW